MGLDQRLAGGRECLNPGEGVLFASYGLTAAPADYGGRGPDGVEDAGGVGLAEGFVEVGFVEDGALLGAG